MRGRFEQQERRGHGRSDGCCARLKPVAAADWLPSQLDLLDAHLAASEASLLDVTPGAEKQIVWGPAGRVRAPWAVIYLHGFTATRQEMAPLPELLAQALGGHVFYARLSGHGRPGGRMAGMSVAQWQADALEALALGHKLGEKVLVMGSSTGATLAAWAALQPQGRDVAACVLVSPNFGPKDRFAALINWAWGRALIHWVHGGVMRYRPRNERKARFWTHEYPTSALAPMMALVRQVRSAKLEAITAPLLMLLSPRDSVINVADARAAFKRFGSAVKCLIEVDYSESAGQHVLAGDIEAPKATATMAAQVLAFVQSLKS